MGFANDHGLQWGVGFLVGSLIGGLLLMISGFLLYRYVQHAIRKEEEEANRNTVERYRASDDPNDNEMHIETSAVTILSKSGEDGDDIPEVSSSDVKTSGHSVFEDQDAADLDGSNKFEQRTSKVYLERDAAVPLSDDVEETVDASPSNTSPGVVSPSHVQYPLAAGVDSHVARMRGDTKKSAWRL